MQGIYGNRIKVTKELIKYILTLIAHGFLIMKTKIICTIGPSSCSPEIITKLISSGMHVARINFAHCTHAEAAAIVSTVRNISKSLNKTVAIWADINGPKVRSGKLENGPVQLIKGNDFYFVNDPSFVGNQHKVATTYTKPLLKVGDVVFIDDGALCFTVTERLADSVKTRIENDGVLGENKGVTFPRVSINDMPTLSERDKADIVFALDKDVDFLSVSCLRDIEDVQAVRMLLGNSRVKLFSKIENKLAMDNFDEILLVSDAIVIDRGYLVSEIDVESLVLNQKRMIATVF
jgi:pyruvate kinase